MQVLFKCICVLITVRIEYGNKFMILSEIVNFNFIELDLRMRTVETEPVCASGGSCNVLSAPGLPSW